MTPDRQPTIEPVAMSSVHTRALASAVIESLTASDLEHVAAQAGVTVELLVTARDAFICAGTAAIHDLDRGRRWLRVLDLARSGRLAASRGKRRR